MTERMTNDNTATPQHMESDVLILIKRMHHQLVLLEKKVDILISQSQEKPREKHFLKPFRSFDRPYHPGRHHQDKRDQGKDSSERGSHSGHHFEKRQREENRGFGGPKKDYSGERENSSDQDRHFKKKYDDKKRGFDPKKKPFYHKYK